LYVVLKDHCRYDTAARAYNGEYHGAIEYVFWHDDSIGLCYSTLIARSSMALRPDLRNGRGTTAVGSNPINYYTTNVSNLVPMIPATVSNVGGSQAHLNMQPFLTLNFCIALQGIFPSPN